MVILPKIGQRVTRPLLGSGSIRRRARIYKYKRKNSFNVKKYIPEKIFQSAVKNEPFIFPNRDCKIIFDYYCNMGFPFTKHRSTHSTTTLICVSKINKALKKYSRKEILKSIDTASIIFNSKWFKYRLYFIKNNISLINFFEYDKKKYMRILRVNSDYPKSWFKECLLGVKKLEEKYSVLLKSKFPWIVETLTLSWKEYLGSEEVQENDISMKDSNNLILIANKVQLFSIKNSIPTIEITGLIHKMLNEFKNFKPVHLGWMFADIFWEKTLPNELVRYGLIKRKDLKID